MREGQECRAKDRKIKCHQGSEARRDRKESRERPKEKSKKVRADYDELARLEREQEEEEEEKLSQIERALKEGLAEESFQALQRMGEL